MARHDQHGRVELMDQRRPANARAGCEICAVIMPAGNEARATVEIDGMFVQGRGFVRLRSFLWLCWRAIDAPQTRQPQIDQLDRRLGLRMAIGDAVRLMEAPGDRIVVPPFSLAR